MSFQQHFQENPVTMTNKTSLVFRNQKQSFLVSNFTKL